MREVPVASRCGRHAAVDSEHWLCLNPIKGLRVERSAARSDVIANPDTEIFRHGTLALVSDLRKRDDRERLSPGLIYVIW